MTWVLVSRIYGEHFVRSFLTEQLAKTWGWDWACVKGNAAHLSSRDEMSEDEFWSEVGNHLSGSEYFEVVELDGVEPAEPGTVDVVKVVKHHANMIAIRAAKRTNEDDIAVLAEAVIWRCIDRIPKTCKAQGIRYCEL